MKGYQKFEDRLNREEARPIPHWIFKAQDFGLWTIFATSVLTGAAAFSVILYAIQQSDFNLLSHFSHSPLEMILSMVPLIWLAAVIIFLTLAVSAYRHTWKAYKFSPLYIFFISVLLSLALGTLFFVAGGARQIDRTFDSTLSSYESIEEKKSEIWHNPEKGLLYGNIISKGNGTLIIRDKNGSDWTITTTDAFVAPVLTLEPGEKIKLMGNLAGDYLFKATEIKPWGGPHMHNGTPGR